MRLTFKYLPICLGALAALLLSPVHAATPDEQFFMLPSYRVGPYGANGQAFYGGFIDYLTYVNVKGGIDGVQNSWIECETEYNTAKGVECYERLKGKAKVSAGPIHVMSTGISYALVAKSAADKLPLAMMGHGLTMAADGSVFPYAFPLVTTYPMQASAIVRFLKDREKGSLAGRKIVFLYHDSAYGNEPIRVLEAESRRNDFELVLIPVPHPGYAQEAQWQRIRQEAPDYVIMWGWGAMNTTALKAAQKMGFPRERMIGSWWAGTEEDTVPAGDAAAGYMAATWNVAGKDVPVIAAIEQTLYDAGKGNLADRSRLGSILYNRGVAAAVLSVEAVRVAQARYGKGRAMTGEQVRWGLENLNLSEARLAALGAGGLLPEMKTSCRNHEGSGKVRIQQWDGTKWLLISDWIAGDESLVRPMLQSDARRYAKERGITPRRCAVTAKKK